jgi:hypothetical protein
MGPIPTRMTRRLALIGCAALLAATPAQAAAKVKRGLYDCYSFSTSIGNTTYRGSVFLKKRGRYRQAAGRHGRSLINPRRGRYSQGGGEIDFKSGPWADLYGVEKATTRFDVWAEGEQIKSWTCYLKP